MIEQYVNIDDTWQAKKVHLHTHVCMFKFLIKNKQFT